MYSEELINKQVEAFLAARKKYYQEKDDDGWTFLDRDISSLQKMELLQAVPAPPHTILFDENGEIFPVVAWGAYKDPYYGTPWWPVVRADNVVEPLVAVWLEDADWLTDFGPMVFTETVPRDRLLVLHRVRLQVLPDVSGAMTDLVRLVESFGLKVADSIEPTR